MRTDRIEVEDGPKVRIIISHEDFTWAIDAVARTTNAYRHGALPGGHFIIPRGIEHARWIVEGVGKNFLILDPPFAIKPAARPGAGEDVNE